MSPPTRHRPTGGGAQTRPAGQAITTNATSDLGQCPPPPATWRQLDRAGLDAATLRIGQVVAVHAEPAFRPCCQHLQRRLDILEHRLREARDLVETIA